MDSAPRERIFSRIPVLLLVWLAMAVGPLVASTAARSANTDPTVSTNTGATTDEDIDHVITQSELETTDSEQGPSDLTYTIDTDVSEGQLQNTNLGIQLNQSDEFTQAEINNGYIEYRHDGTEPTNEYFDFTVRDGDGGSATGTFSITINQVNDAPTISGDLSLSLDEGTAVTIGNSDLDANDPDDSGTDLTYTVTSTPSNGQIEVSGSAVSSFTEAQLNNGNVEYVHDGSETTSDSFDVELADNDGATTNSQTVNVSINSVNDQPTVATNAGSTVNQGSNNDIIQSELETTDTESGPSSLTYTIDTDVFEGQLHNTNLGIQLNQSDEFTQAEINNGYIEYRHDGTEPTNEYFDFTVRDGDGGSVSSSFSVTINDVPSISGDLALSTSEGGAVSLDSADLRADDSTDSDSALTYTVTSAPANGSIQVSGSAVTSFTEADLNNGNVDYVHDDSETTADSFDVELADDDGATSNTETVSVSIDPINESPTLSGDGALSTDEGTAVTLTSTDLEATDPDDSDSNLNYLIYTNTPDHGTTEVSGSPDSQWTEAELDAGTVEYVHDGSETTSDNFYVKVRDADNADSSVKTVSVTINPVNDAPTLSGDGALSTDAGAVVTLTSTDLEATDPDDSGSNLTYTVTSAPSDGQLEVSGAAASSFTEADLDNGKVDYVHDGTGTVSDSFEVELADDDGATSSTQTVTVTDNDAPTLTRSTPADGSSVHPPGNNLILTFDENVILGTGNVDIVDEGDGSSTRTLDVATSSVSVSGDTITLTPSSDLERDTAYHVDVDSTAVDDDNGNDFAGSGFSDPGVLNFTTADIDPAFTAGSSTNITVDEDTSADLTDELAVSDISSSDTLTWSVVAAPSNGGLSGIDGETRNVSGSDSPHKLSTSPTYTPTNDVNGADSFDIEIGDTNPGTGTDTITVSVTIDAVNDAPSFSLPSNPDQSVSKTTSAQTVAGFIDTATFDPGPNEAGQSISDFLVSTSDSSLFETDPDIDNNGDLTFKPADDVQGTASVDVQVKDDGGTSNGGTDTSTTRSFNITVDTQGSFVESESVVCTANCSGNRNNVAVSTTITTSNGNSALAVTVHKDGDPSQTDLSAAGVGADASTEYEINVTTNDLDPTVGYGNGDFQGPWTETTPRAGQTRISLVTRPVAVAKDTDAPSGAKDDPTSSYWDGEKVADTTNTSIDIGFATLGGANSDRIDGAYFNTNAQAFANPSVDQTRTNPRLNLGMAAPHFASDGVSLNTGHLQAHLPDSLVNDVWGGATSSQYVAAFGSQLTSTPTATSTGTGTELVWDGFQYSDGIGEAGLDNTVDTVEAGSSISASVGDSVTFDGTGSSDEAGIQAYDWDVDNDTNYEKTGPEPSSAFGPTGEQTVRLRVTDNNGNVGTDTVTVSVPACEAVSYSGAGTVADPYQVDNLARLQCIDANHASASTRADALAASYELTQDIDASSTSDWNGGDGFDPIGDDGNAFSGSFHGLGNRISNLTIDRTTDAIGLVAVSNGEVEHLELDSVSITGGAKVGGLAGENYGYVSDVAVTGSVTGTSGTTGGLVGFNGQPSDRSIRNASAVVSVTGDSYAGGLVGQHTRTGVAVRNSFSAGSATGSSNDGGFVGLIDNDAVIEKSYWDTDVQSTGVGNTGSSSPYGNFNATGLTTAEMQGPNADQQMTALDFANTWRTTSGYPELRHQLSPSFTNSSPSVGVDEYGSLDLTSVLEATDVSPGDTLTWTVVSTPSDGALSGIEGESESIAGTNNRITLSSSPTYTPDAGFTGSDSFEVQVTDNSSGTSRTITVSVTVDPVPASISAPPDLALDAEGLYTRVDLERDGVASAKDGAGNSLTTTLVNGTTPAWLRPGTHEFDWSATDSDGNTVTATQTVAIRPRVGLGMERSVQEGGSVALAAELNGDAVDGTTPTLDYAPAQQGSADSGDHNLVAGSLSMANQRDERITFDVASNDAAGEGPETLIVALTDAMDAVLGQRRRAELTLVESNTAPRVTLSAAQAGGSDPAVIIDGSAGAGAVTVTAATRDATDPGSMSFAWNGAAAGLTDTDGVADDASFTFDPAGLKPGLYQLKVTATDDGTPAKQGHAGIPLRVVSSLQSLGTDDADTDGVDDVTEGRADRDGDGVAAYRDPYQDRNTVHQALTDNAGYRLETRAGLNLALGPIALKAGADGARVSADEIETITGWRDDRTNVGGYFDLTLRALPQPGASVPVVIPQREPIPEDPVYRKLGAAGGWQDFVTDEANALASAPGAEGYCPPPDDDAFTPGLTPGDWCVRVTLGDGGPNDADGSVNGRIRNAGGLARQLQAPDRVEADSSGGGVWSFAWFGLVSVLMTLRLGRKREIH